MKKASIIMAGLACAMIAAAYTNSVPISTNTRAATEKWTAIRFEPALPPTPANAASKFLTGNREWQTVTAAQIGALTNETDEAALAALAAYAAYWPRNATASSWFTFTTNSGAITITGYNTGGGTDVVIPDYINGFPVTEIGANAFRESGVMSIGGAGNVVTVRLYAFSDCYSLASVSLPQVQKVGESAFYSCTSLASVYFDNDAPTIGVEIFAYIPPNQVTIYVTNPTATGWGATFAGMPVVRLPLYADAIYQAGGLVATTGYVEQSIASQLPGIVYSNSVSAFTIYTNDSGAATSWWQVTSGVTNSGLFASGTPGAITNGMIGTVLDGLTITNNNLDVLSSITIGGDTTYNTWQRHLYQAVYPVAPTLYAQGLVFDNAYSRELKVFHVSEDGVGGITFLTGINTQSMSERMRIQTSSGDMSIWNNLTVAKTNTAAVVVSQGPVFFGPVVNGKQMFLDGDGTNAWIVNVNSVTNAL